MLPLERRFTAASLIACALIFAGCEEEQRLYTIPAEESIPEVPDRPASINQANLGNRGQVGELPPPESTEFRGAFSEPVRLADLAGYQFELPRAYIPLSAASQMRLAEFEVPGEEGSRGELVVFYFGPGQGGDAASNAGRWQAQFAPELGDETPLKRYQQEQRDEVTVTRVSLEGQWNQPAMPGAGGAPEPLPGWAMDAVILEGGPEGSLFLRLTGPRRVVRAEADAMENLAATAVVSAPSLAAESDPHAGHDHAGHDHDHSAHDHSAHDQTGHDHAAHEDAAPATDAPAALEGGVARVDVEGVSFAIPAAWQENPPSSSMRALEFTIPGQRGQNNAELAVFYFGPSGGGPAESNIDRWIGQVSQPDGSATADKAEIVKRVVNGLAVHQVIATGTYRASGMGPMAPPAEPQDGYTLLGIIVEGGPRGPFYVRITGPQETVAAWQQSIDALVGSMVKTSELPGA